MKTQVIYEPRGRAGEYSPLAANLYAGCSHGCTYCYAPAVTYKTPEDFLGAKPRAGILEKLAADVRRLAGAEKRPVLLCFTCDPFQPLEAELGITRQAIQILHAGGIPVTILTKAGHLAERDFDLLGTGDSFGVSLTFLNDKDSLTWEPHAALPGDRMTTLRHAHERGVRTWVSLEPVIDPAQTLEIIRQTSGFVDLFKVGKLNHHPAEKLVDWAEFAVNAVRTLEELGCDYYLKADLRAYLTPPATFRR